METFADLYHGGGGASLGAKQAGLECIWGIEYDGEIADVSAQNGHNVIVKDLLQYSKSDIKKLAVPDILHASPVCKSFSTASTGTKENSLDIEHAKKICDFVDIMQPEKISLENVWGYAGSNDIQGNLVKTKSFTLIENCLIRNKYYYDYWKLNSANYGVPQNRKRLILLADKSKKPLVPKASNSEKVSNGQVSLFDNIKPLVSWYTALESIIDTLPESELAEWQIERLRESDLSKQDYDAILFPCGNTSTSRPILKQEPSNTLTASLVNKQQIHKAVLIYGGNSTSNGKRYILPDRPSMTIAAADGLAHKVITHKVFKLTIEALAILQSFPSWYEFPESKTLSTTIIGNSCCPLKFKKIYQSMTEN